MTSSNLSHLPGSNPSPENYGDQATVPLGVELVLDKLSFGETLILENLELILPAGQITCLLGPSGVGKTSILKILAGFIPLTGNSRITCSDSLPLHSRVSYMDQSDLLLPWASVVENVAIGARLRGERPDLMRAREILCDVGLKDWLSARPDILSGGMRQRVALARTLMDDCPVVLMDEPFSALDALTKLRLQDMAAKLLHGKTVLLITHDPIEALRLGHVIHVLSGSPTRISNAIRPDEAIPRDPASDSLKSHYSDIMEKLSQTEADIT